MRQDKDRGSKWLLAHHADAILKLGGITGFTSWKVIQPETVAPRRLPDGLIEVRYPSETEATLVLVEIESYPVSNVDRCSASARRRDVDRRGPIARCDHERNVERGVGQGGNQFWRVWLFSEFQHTHTRSADDPDHHEFLAQMRLAAHDSVFANLKQLGLDTGGLP